MHSRQEGNHCGRRLHSSTAIPSIDGPYLLCLLETDRSFESRKNVSEPTSAEPLGSRCKNLALSWYQLQVAAGELSLTRLRPGQSFHRHGFRLQRIVSLSR